MKNITEKADVEIDVYELINTIIERPLKAVVNNLNTGIDSEALYHVLTAEGIKLRQMPNLKWAYIAEEGDLSSTLPYRYGLYYIMEVVSLAPAYLLLDRDFRCILDISAAPGGKTLLLSNLYPNSIIVANEPVRNRFLRLEHNVRKYGLINVIRTRYRGEKFPTDAKFDLVLFDAPCSSLNLLYKRRTEVNRNLANSREYGELQKKIIERISRLIKDGGELIYMTCTLSKYECSEVVEHALELGFEALDVKNRVPFRVKHPDANGGVRKSAYILPSLNKDLFGGNIGLRYIAHLRWRGG